MEKIADKLERIFPATDFPILFYLIQTPEDAYKVLFESLYKRHENMAYVIVPQLYEAIMMYKEQLRNENDPILAFIENNYLKKY